MRFILLIAVLVLVSGCLGFAPPLDEASTDDADGGLTRITKVSERNGLPFVTSGSYSSTLQKGVHKILPPISVLVDVSVPLGNGLPTQQAHMGVFLPDVPEGTKVPVVADVGPYYGDGDVAATTPANRLGKFLIENLVPHGYAVAQVSVLGTGQSVGCMDLMGEVEQAGIQAAVEWLGTQPWSNGNVGLIGRSYDGSTPWEAAMKGSAHLKTVVPISGLFGQYELMWRNGSAEARGPGLLWGIYYIDSYGGEAPPLQAQQAAANTACPDSTTGGARHVGTYLTGDGNPGSREYWEERSFKKEVLQNYHGSVYFIHGLQDWNVDPHMAFPFYNELEANGLEMKGLFGQWAHNYPDRLKEHKECDGLERTCHPPESVRWDWAQDLLEWFDHYLKGTGAKPELHVEIQADDGGWRVEPTWPPADASLVTWKLGTDLKQTSAGQPLVIPGADVLLASRPLEADTRIIGLPQLHVQVTPLGPGGQVYAELRDKNDQHRRIGHAIMDLRFAAGGQEARPVVPGVPLVAKMEFEPFDAFVPKGHTLEIVLSYTGQDYLPPDTSAAVLLQVNEQSVFRFLTVERGPDAFFKPPGGA